MFPLEKPDIGSVGWGSAVNGNWDTLNSAFLFWSKIVTSTKEVITGTASAVLNRLHVISGTSSDYDITISGLSPSTGDVVGFYVDNYASANKQFRLDAGGSVMIAGRTRYITLVHTNVALLMWDGSNWQPLVICLDTPWINAGAINLAATTTNPSKGTTTYDRVLWRRIGNDCELRWEYRQTTAGTAGSGDYLLVIPFGAIDITLITAETGASSSVTLATAGAGCGRSQQGGTVGVLWLSVYDATRFRFVYETGPGAVGFAASGTLSFAATTYGFIISGKVPMVNW